jgi:membrane-bound lytic murein transglycosylase D
MDWNKIAIPALRAGTFILLASLLSACATRLPFVNGGTAANEAIAEAPAAPVQTRTADEVQPATAAEILQPAEYDDLWDRIRANFRMRPINNRQVAYYEKWYSDRPEYVKNMVRRASLYLHYIVEEVEKRDMPGEIALLPAIESAFKPRAYSRARASGLWQFIPSTGRRYGLKQNWWYDGRRDIIMATHAALNYLQKLHAEFGDWHLALAAYNAGENRIRKAIRHNGRRGHSTDYVALRKIKRETRHYVPKLVAIVNIVREPAKYGLQLQAIPNEPYFAQVNVGSQIDLGVVAKALDTSVHNLSRLNPGYKRWATDPRGPHVLLIPRHKKDQLLASLKQLPASKRMQWTRYQVRRGDSLSTIAHRYGLSVSALRSSNNLRGNFIRAGQDLLIPLSSRKMRSRPVVRLARAKKSRARVAGKPKNANTQVVHHVRKGDTLWAIANQYQVYISQLRRWNGIRGNQVLRLGQKILIWKP